jgi:hypothetical protein
MFGLRGPGLIGWLIGLARALRTDGVEPRLLLVVQRSVEVIERQMHGLDRLQHRVEPFADRRKSCGGRERAVGRARGVEQASRLGGGVLERDKTCALCPGWDHRLVDFGGRPIEHAGLRTTAGIRHGLALTLILAERGQPRLLVIAEQTVELLKRRLHGIDRCDHCLDALLHGGEPARSGERDFGGTASLDVARRLGRGVSEIIERDTLRVVRLDRLLDLIDRKAGDVAGILAAHLRQRAGCDARGRGRLGAAVGACARLLRQVAGEIVVAVGREDAGVEIVVAVVPERVFVAVAPERVVVHVMIGERPEHRADPSVSAVPVLPPATTALASALPSGRRGLRGDEGAGVRVAQCARIVRCALARAGIQCAAHGIGPGAGGPARVARVVRARVACRVPAGIDLGSAANSVRGIGGGHGSVAATGPAVGGAADIVASITASSRARGRTGCRRT